MDLGEVAGELYALPPTQFVAARDARVAELRASDKELARAVAALRRPGPAAWAVNLLARAGTLDDLVELGERFRAAQGEADRAKVLGLSQERRDRVRELVDRAGDLTAAAGTRLSQTVLDEVARTLEAATADASAADAIRSGRLLRGLTSVGFDPVDLTDAVAAADGEPSRRRRRSGPRPVTDPEAELRRARKEADAVVEDARRALARAEDGIHEIAERAAEVDRRRDELEAGIADLERELHDARRGLDDAERELTRLDRERGVAERRADRSREALRSAEADRARWG